MSGPNSGVRLCFHIENRIRGGFSLVIGLTFHEGLCHLHKGLPQRAITSVELRSLIKGQGVPVDVDCLAPCLLILSMIRRRGRGLAKPAKKLPGLFRQGQAVGVARLLHLGAAPLVPGRLVAPQPVDEAMRPQVLQRPHDRIARPA